MKPATPKKQTHTPLLTVTNLNLDTPTGKPLFRELNLTMGYEKVAMIGRNGVGKSSLLESLYHPEQINHGRIQCTAKPYIVYQNINKNNTLVPDTQTPHNILTSLNLPDKQINHELLTAGISSQTANAPINTLSNGERRKLYLLTAKIKNPDLLLLDEPTEDLDETGIHWLIQWLQHWQNGLIIISHEKPVLRTLTQFLVMSETGCQYFNGSFDQLEQKLDQENKNKQKKYLRNLNHLITQEKHNEKKSQRQQQKKKQGRLRELSRMTPKVLLNKKRSDAQESQGKAANTRNEKIKTTRELIKAKRRHLAVSLPMKLTLPPQPPKEKNNTNIITLKNISAIRNNKLLFQNINLSLQSQQRLAITGPNGSGKTTLLNIILGHSLATSGSSIIQNKNIGSITQGASNWMKNENLITEMLLSTKERSTQGVLSVLTEHKYPTALAERPLQSLSPGERVRAALISLLTQQPVIECLILDEPTYSLDFEGITALRATLKAWQGTLIIVSHDQEFLNDIGIHHHLQLNTDGTHTYK